MSKPGRPELDAAGAACRNAQHELEEITERLRGLRFKRETLDLRAGHGPAFTELSLALYHMGAAIDCLRNAAAGFYAENPDIFWVDAEGNDHYDEEEKE